MTTSACKREVTGRAINKPKTVDGDRGGHPKEKWEKEERSDDPVDGAEGVDVGENYAGFEGLGVIPVSLNLSKKNLKNFPEALLDRMTDVQYLYLEGNKLAVLPRDFFQRLHFLKWLDLRNNCLTALPTVGLTNHSTLETILLQGNRLRSLPTELASIPSLKGLQIAGNPIDNVPPKVVEGGFEEVMKYLRKMLTENEILLPVSETILVRPSTSRGEADEPKEDAELKMWDLDKLTQWRQSPGRKAEGAKRPGTKNASDKPISQQAKISVSLRSHPKLPLRPQPFRCGVYNKNRHRATASALRCLKMRKTRLGYKKRPITLGMIQEKAIREAHRAQVRETLEKQARKIQRMRDKEVLKNWRDHARITRHQLNLLDNYQQYPSKDFASKTPFDVDPEFLNMLNRVDLYRSLKEYDNKSKRSGKARVRITAVDLERQMNEVMKKLEQLDTDDSGDTNSPRSKRSHMCERMHKIMDIQKTLKSLQTLNSSLNGIVPIVKPKPKN